jgi:NitT/TauT family transport system substrate-binding protein
MRLFFNFLPSELRLAVGFYSRARTSACGFFGGPMRSLWDGVQKGGGGVPALLASLLFGVSFLPGCTKSQPVSQQPVEVEKLRLALNWKPEPEFGGFYAAQLAGLDRERQLALEIVPGGSGQPVVQMVASGQFDFGIASADEVLIARDRGADVVAFFAVYQTNPTGILVHASRGFNSLADVFASSGTTLAIQKGLPHTAFLEKKFGFGKLKVVPYTGGVAAFLRDSKFVQQCFVTAEPLAARREKAQVRSFLIADSGYNPYTAVVVTRGELRRRRPELIERVAGLFRAGWERYLADPAPANQAMFALNSSMDLEIYAESAKVQEPLVVSEETRRMGLGAMTLARWKELGEQLRELGLLDKAAVPEEAFFLPGVKREGGAL